MYILKCINSCWAKLQKYYALTDESLVYDAAIALNPEYKLDYFKMNWEEHEDWIKYTEEGVENLWRIIYKNYANSTEVETIVKARTLDSGLFLLTPRKEPSNFD